MLATTPASSPVLPAVCTTSATKSPSAPPHEVLGGASYLVAPLSRGSVSAAKIWLLGDSEFAESLCMRVSNRYVPPERSAVSSRDRQKEPL